MVKRYALYFEKSSLKETLRYYNEVDRALKRRPYLKK